MKEKKTIRTKGLQPSAALHAFVREIEEAVLEGWRTNDLITDLARPMNLIDYQVILERGEDTPTEPIVDKVDESKGKGTVETKNPTIPSTEADTGTHGGVSEPKEPKPAPARKKTARKRTTKAKSGGL